LGTVKEFLGKGKTRRMIGFLDLVAEDGRVRFGSSYDIRILEEV